GSPGSGSGVAVKAPALPGAADADQAGAVPAPLQKHRGRYQLLDEKTGTPLAGAAYVLVQPDGTRLAGYSDEKGLTLQAVTEGQADLNLLTPQRKPAPVEHLFRMGEAAPMKISMDYKNS
ncbi:hypothetical protein, partial [Pseudomonas fulva]|uniref:hypothetical protein n=1 Tax=Pseudomonas fulva TaxID=47880 RepID=UPI00244A8812